MHVKDNIESGPAWWHLLLILAIRRLRQEELCEFKVSPLYIGSSRSQDYIKIFLSSWAVVARAFNSSIRRQRQVSL